MSGGINYSFTEKQWTLQSFSEICDGEMIKLFGIINSFIVQCDGEMIKKLF